jgi:modulator of FtsH protease HflK
MKASTRVGELGNDLRAAMRGSRRVFIAALAVAIIGWLCSGVKSIRANEVGLVRRFGQLVREQHKPGLKFLLPWPIERLERVPTTDVLSVWAGFATDTKTLHPVEEMSTPYCLTGDQNIIHISVVALYRIKTPRQYLYGVENAHSVLRSVLNGVIIGVAAGMEVDAILTDKKAVLRDRVLERANRILDGLESGLSITRLTLKTIGPPSATKAAFEAVNNAKVGMRKARSDADKYRKQVVRDARGRAAQMQGKAEGDAYLRVQRACADVARFEAVRKEYELDKSITRVRMYLQAMAKIMKKAKVYILPRGNGGPRRRSVPPAVLDGPQRSTIPAALGGPQP